MLQACLSSALITGFHLQSHLIRLPQTQAGSGGPGPALGSAAGALLVGVPVFTWFPLALGLLVGPWRRSVGHSLVALGSQLP